MASHTHLPRLLLADVDLLNIERLCIRVPLGLADHADLEGMCVRGALGDNLIGGGKSSKGQFDTL
jgi:hypothetical protein